MQRNRLPAIALALLLLPCASTFALADGGFPGGRHWAVGGVLAMSPSPFVDHATEFVPLPMLIYQSDRLQAAGLDTRYRVFEGPGFAVQVAGGFRFEGYRPKSGSALEGMASRRGAFELGLDVSLARGPGLVRLSAMTDVTGTHRGQELGADYALAMGGDRLIVTTSAGLALKSARLVDYYYGVRAAEARASRPAYEGDWALNPRAGLEFAYVVSWNWVVTGAGRYERLSGNIVNSPIVDDRSQVGGHLSLARIF